MSNLQVLRLQGRRRESLLPDLSTYLRSRKDGRHLVKTPIRSTKETPRGRPIRVNGCHPWSSLLWEQLP